MLEDAGIAGECLKTGQPVICNDPAGHPAFNANVDRRSGWKTRNLLAIPLTAEGLAFGVLEILNKPGAGFSSSDLELAQAFAQLSALAIWNCRRYARCFSALALDVGQSSSGSPMIGRSKAITELKELIPRFARSDSPVLIIGESGVGKEVLARLLWKSSGRARKVFSAVNCAAIPPTLIESELFGHEKGAFTGAHARRLGRFEDADKGTLFLDEIGELPLEMQAKLLRVLQEMEVTRIGSTKPVKVDVRIIAATNRDLKDAVAKKLFREDLYYRLNVLNIRVPSLRERQDDIEELARFFIAQFNESMGRAVEGMSPELIERFRGYSWPGNIRELRNTIERLMVLCDGTILTDELLPANIR
jgi:Nif-specific regulatory protein